MLSTARPLLVLLSLFVLAGCPTKPATVESEAEEAVCYDGADNDSDSASDCSDPGCSDLLACCVASSEVACCEPRAAALSLDFSTCSPAMLGKCGPTLVTFGSSTLEDGALVPLGTTQESGVYFSTPLDPRGSNYRIVFDGARATSCGGGCLNHIEIGLNNGPPVASNVRVYYDFSIALRPAFGDLAVFSPFDAVAGQWPIDAGVHRYAIDVRTDATITLTELDASGATARTLASNLAVVLNDPAYLVISGRREGLDAGVLPSRIGSVAVERGRCDRPQNVHAGSVPVIPAPGSAEAAVLTDVEGVGRAVTAGGTDLAIIDDGSAFHLFRTVGAAWAPVGTLSAPFLSLSMIPTAGATAIDDPWLVADEAATRWQLYFTVRTGPNAASIARVSSAAGFATTVDLSTYAIVAEPTTGYPRFEMPTVLDDLMVIRAANADLAFLVRLVRSGERWVPVGENLLDGEVNRAKPSNTPAMDRDEVADPALVREGGAYRLYFAGRRGTRWRVGLLMSEGGAHWHQPFGTEPLWELEGGSFAFLAARDPAPRVVDGAVQMLYRGGNGLRHQVGRADSNTPRSFPLPPP